MSTYAITALGAFSPRGINSSAIITGRMETGAGERGFALRKNALRELLPLPGQLHASAEGINDLNHIVGNSRSNNGTVIACYWDQSGVAHPLSGDSRRTTALAINNAGTAVGMGESGMNPVRWADGAISELSLPDTPYPYSWIALGINNDGEIIANGSSYHWDQGGAAAYWNPLGIPHLLRVPPEYTIAEAMAINDASLIVGCVAVKTGSWTERRNTPCLWNSLQPRLLPLPLDALGGYASDINDHGLIVGGVEFATGRRAHAWLGHTLIDLNSLIAPSLGWTLTHAQYVNNAGDIVGYGIHAGVERERAWHMYLEHSIVSDFDLPEEIVVAAFDQHTRP